MSRFFIALSGLMLVFAAVPAPAFAVDEGESVRQTATLEGEPGLPVRPPSARRCPVAGRRLH